MSDETNCVHTMNELECELFVGHTGDHLTVTTVTWGRGVCDTCRDQLSLAEEK